MIRKSLDGLTHMNGRLYDPVLARFVSADPIVQDTYNLQSLNRYSYVLNNPLYYTDPSGYSAWTKFRDRWLKPAAAVAAAWVVGPAVFNAVLPSAVGAAGATGLGMSGSLWTGSVIAGAASGAAVGGIAGGIYNGPQGIAQGAKYGAIGGAITGPVAAMYGGINGQGGSPWGWDRVAAQSVSGGLASAAQGGSFADGFRSSFATSAARYSYNAFVGYDVDPRSGVGLAPRGPNDPPPPFVNTIATQDQRLVGDFVKDFAKEGGALSNFLNSIPGINAVSKLHDTIVIQYAPDTLMRDYIMNTPTMLPAAAVTYAGLLDGYGSAALNVNRVKP